MTYRAIIAKYLSLAEWVSGSVRTSRAPWNRSRDGPSCPSCPHQQELLSSMHYCLCLYDHAWLASMELSRCFIHNNHYRQLSQLELETIYQKLTEFESLHPDSAFPEDYPPHAVIQIIAHLNYLIDYPFWYPGDTSGSGYDPDFWESSVEEACRLYANQMGFGRPQEYNQLRRLVDPQLRHASGLRLRPWTGRIPGRSTSVA